MRYSPQLYPVKDSIGNRHSAGVQYDEIDGTYVGSIKSYRGVIIGIGEAGTPHEAADNAALNLSARLGEQLNARKAIVSWALSEHREAVGDHLDLSDEELLALGEEEATP